MTNRGEEWGGLEHHGDQCKEFDRPRAPESNRHHRRHKATDKAIYLDALTEDGRRRGGGLTFEKSREIILKAAAKGHFLSYKDLADASGVKWELVHHKIGSHLWQLVEFAHRQGWPMLSAVVVNKPNVNTGEMEPGALKGFIGAAEDLGYIVIDKRAFLKEQQSKVFAWAQGKSRHDGVAETERPP
jgi:hypothetical protein